MLLGTCLVAGAVGPKAGKNAYEYTTEIDANQVPAADVGRYF
jgi:hypothetical protein